MKYFSRLFSLVTFALILLAPLSGFAASHLPASISGADLFSVTQTDKSIQYLSQIFGTMGGVLHGSSGQLLGEVFRYFNMAMVFIAFLIISYTGLRGVIDTAQDGEFMGKKTNAGWAIFRAVTGICILVPKYTGYSLVQVFIMWVTVQGVGLADKTWNMAVDHISNGGVVFQDPDDALTNPAEYYSQYAFRDGIKKNVEVSQNILKSEVCMYKLQDLAQAEREKALQQLKTDPSNPILQWKSKFIPTYTPKWNDEAKVVTFGIPSDAPGADRVCGYYSWQDSRANFEQYKKAGLNQMIADLAPAAKAIAVSTNPARKVDISEESLQQKAVAAVTGATIDYANLMQPVLRNVLGKSKEQLKVMLDKTKTTGWIMAGSYYWDLAGISTELDYDLQNYQPEGKGIQENIGSYNIDAASVQSTVNKVDKLASSDSVYSYMQAYADRTAANTDIIRSELPTGVNELVALPLKDEVKLRDIKGSMLAAGSDLAQRASENSIISAASPIIDLWKYTPAGWLASETKAKEKVTNAVVSTLEPFFNSVNQLTNTWLNVMSNPNGDPIYKIQILGREMIDVATNLWVGGAISLAISVGTVTFFSTWVNLASAIEAGLKLLVPIYIAMIGAMFVTGFTFAVYIPLIPYLIFTFAAVGWLISVLEAIVAGPLVAAAVTHPEGHDLLGKAEQSLMLLMGVFLRPVIMIIGFLAAMVMSRVILRIVNAGFAHVVASSEVTLHGGVNWLVSILALVVIYTMTVVGLVNLIYNAGIVKLWETIWMWIGFHKQADASGGADHAMQEIKGSAQSGIKSAGDVGTEGFKGGVDAAGKYGAGVGSATSTIGKGALGIAKWSLGKAMDAYSNRKKGGPNITNNNKGKGN
jgi:defect-in-organelle-trafficking protein DotA